MRDLVAGTGGASGDVVLDILLHSWPPEALFSHKERPSGTGMTCNETGVGPLKDLWTEIRGHKRSIGWVTTGGVLVLALRTFSSIPQVTALTTQDEGRMLEGTSEGESGECILDKASGFPFLGPGRYDRVKLERLKNRAHLA